MPARQSPDGKRYILSGNQQLVFADHDKIGRLSMNGCTEQELIEVLEMRIGKGETIIRILGQMCAADKIDMVRKSALFNDLANLIHNVREADERAAEEERKAAEEEAAKKKQAAEQERIEKEKAAKDKAKAQEEAAKKEVPVGEETADNQNE